MVAFNNAADWYKAQLAKWPGKQVGGKPTAAQLDTIHKLGARPGKQALANAMMLRPTGATGAQIVIACGAPQLNKMRDFVAKGLAKRVATNPDGNGHTVYRLALTPKGEAKVKAAGDAPAVKPAKAKRVAKAKPSTPAIVAAETAISEAQPQG